ncbi:MAG: succinate dehydrogenase [SAR324 cluster bacterium]|nr:succinate dehydrogenase [SAR324 cluster bacterium]
MDSAYVTRRLHSLTGIIPVGLFLVYHLYLQLFLHAGADIYNAKVNSFYDSPLAIWILVFLVYLPLLFHTILGIKLAVQAKIQPTYKHFNHLLYWLQRLSGAGVFLFIGGHLFFTKVEPMLAGTWGAHWQHLNEGYHSPTALVTKAVYVFGILGATFHFSNGINTFCMTWGIALTAKAQDRIRSISILVFVLLTISAYYAISAIW